MRERETAAESLRNQIEVSSAQVLQSEDEITALRERLSQLEHEISGMQQRGLQLKSEADRQESQIHFNEERLRELAAQNAKAIAEINQAEERQHIADQEQNSVTSKLDTSKISLLRQRTILEEKESALRQVEENLRQQQEI